MAEMQVGELKARFSELMQRVKQGEEIIISYGRRQERIAVIVPYERYRASHAVQLGTLAGSATAEFATDFKMTDEELLEP